MLPKVENRYGAVFLDDPVETPSFEVLYSLDIKNDKNTIQKKYDVDDIEGIVLWYLNHKPEENDMSTSFGFKHNFNGLGLYIFKHEGRWRVLAIYNRGYDGLTVSAAVNNLTQADNSCMLPEFDGGQLNIVYRVDRTQLFVDYSFGDDQPYKSCISGKRYVGFQTKGYIGVTAGNPI